MTETETIQEEKKKKKTGPTYTELVNEAGNITAKTISSYIPDLCIRLREENPDKQKFPDITLKERIVKDCSEFWSKNYIRKFWPEWVKNPDRVKGGVSKHIKYAQKKKEREEIVKFFQQMPNAEPSSDDDLDEPFENVGVGGGKTVMDAYEAMNQATYDFWDAYTNGQRPHPPHSREDLENDFIKPTREFRKIVAHEIAPDMLLATFNDLVCTEALIRDTIQIFKGAMNK